MTGVPSSGFQGLRKFFRRLEAKSYKMHVRVFLSRWRGYHECPACLGARLRPEALAVRVGGLDIAKLSRLTIREARAFLARYVRGGRSWTTRWLDGCWSRLGGPARRARPDRPGLPDARPPGADAFERRGATPGPGLGARLGPGQHALRARRAVGRPPPSRRRPLDRDARRACETRATRWSSSSTTRRSSGPPTGSSTSARAPASRAGGSSTKGRPTGVGDAADSATGAYLSGPRGEAKIPEHRRKPKGALNFLEGATGNNLKGSTSRSHSACSAS